MTCGTMKVMLDLSKESTMAEIQVGDTVVWEKRKGIVASLGKVMAVVWFPHSRPYRMIIETNLLERKQDND